jgi:hypothetical protein
MKNEQMDKAVEKAINDLEHCEDNDIRILVLERLYIQAQRDQLEADKETIEKL